MRRLLISSNNILTLELRDADSGDPIENASVYYEVLSARDNSAIAFGFVPHEGQGRYSVTLAPDLPLHEGALYIVRVSAVLPSGTAHTQQVVCIAQVSSDE